MEFTPLLIPIYVLCFIVSLGLHEAMHALVAHKLGDTTASGLGRVTLNPFKHIDLFTTVLLPLGLMLVGLPPFLIAKPVPVDSRNLKFGDFGMALVGVAGPFTNLVLAFVAAFVLKSTSLVPGSLLSEIAILFVALNVATFIFNMIPFPPLDGSRVIYAVAPPSVQRVMEHIEAFGIMGILIFMFLLFPLIRPIIINLNNSLLQVLLS